MANYNENDPYGLNFPEYKYYKSHILKNPSRPKTPPRPLSPKTVKKSPVKQDIFRPLSPQKTRKLRTPAPLAHPPKSLTKAQELVHYLRRGEKDALSEAIKDRYRNKPQPKSIYKSRNIVYPGEPLPKTVEYYSSDEEDDSVEEVDDSISTKESISDDESVYKHNNWMSKKSIAPKIYPMEDDIPKSKKGGKKTRKHRKHKSSKKTKGKSRRK